MKVLAALLAVAVLAVGCGRANSENAAFVGPLDVIPDLDVEDPLVTCPGTPAVRYSRMIDPPSIDEVDHPAVDALRALLDAPGVEPLPQGRWVVISIDDDSAEFATLADDSFWVAGIDRQGDKWVRTGQAASDGPCEPAVPLPAGLVRVEVRLDPDSMPGAADTTIDLLVTERCSVREMGDALKVQVIETDVAVLVAFAVIPVAGDGDVTCPGNPSTSVTIELSDPLGQRGVYDGLFFPPKPLVAVAGHSSDIRDRESDTQT